MVSGPRSWKAQRKFRRRLETCAFDIIGAKYIRDIEPGEVLEIGPRGLKSIRFEKKKPHAFCILNSYISPGPIR